MDKELLEGAAQAAGICGMQYADGAYDWPGKAGRWNPLKDNSDALHLLVRLTMMVDFITKPGSYMMGYVVAVSNAGAFYEPGFTAESTRRAIVRAACATVKPL